MIQEKKGWSIRAPPTSGSGSLNWAESIHSMPKNCPGSTSAMHVHSYICGRPLQHCPPHINFLFLEPPFPSPSLSLSQTSCVSHTQTLLVSQIYERPPKSTHFSIFKYLFLYPSERTRLSAIEWIIALPHPSTDNHTCAVEKHSYLNAVIMVQPLLFNIGLLVL